MHMFIAVESGFAPNLYDLCRNVVHEFVVLSRHSLEGEQAALETMLQERLVSNTVSVTCTLLVWLIIVAYYCCLVYV